MTNFLSFFQRVLILFISIVKLKVMGVKVPGPALCNQAAQNVPTLTPPLPFTGRQTLLRPDGFLPVVSRVGLGLVFAVPTVKGISDMSWCWLPYYCVPQ